ncbi:hypothetical protein [Haloferula sargassicola]|uniref:HEAT repeat domain-containing protein n=1 Tax=Haloferula sargassicola TaxID=490096 RepID=A0ABP9UQ74_9BACT
MGLKMKTNLLPLALVMLAGILLLLRAGKRDESKTYSSTVPNEVQRRSFVRPEPSTDYRPHTPAGNKVLSDYLATAQEILARMRADVSKSGSPSREDYKSLLRIIAKLSDSELREVAEELAASENSRLVGIIAPSLLNRIFLSDIETSDICDWIGGLKNATARNYFLQITGAALPALRAIDPHQLAERFEEPDDRKSILEGYVSSIVKESPLRALRFLLSNIPSDSNQDSIGKILVILPEKTDFPEVIRFLLESDYSGAKESTADALKTWARYDPKSACEFAFAETRISNGYLRMIADSWVHSNPRDFLAWIQNLPAGDKRDEAAASFSIARGEMGSEEAWQVATTIDDPDLRLKTLEAVYGQWKRHAETRANHAMQTFIKAQDAR